MSEAPSPRGRLALLVVIVAVAGVLLALADGSQLSRSHPMPSAGPFADVAVDKHSRWRRSASFERDLTTGTDGWNLSSMPQVSGFTITRSDDVGGARGSWAAKIVSEGGNSGCSCPRMQFEDGFRYEAGREVWLRGSWYFPDPAAITWSRMMNVSSFRSDPATDYYTGLVVEGEDGRMLVRTRRYQSARGEQLIFPSRRIPVGRWFTVVLRFKLSPTTGRALNEWYVDGRLVGRNRVANMHNEQAINTYQGGMPYFREDIHSTVYFDNPGLKDRSSRFTPRVRPR